VGDKATHGKGSVQQVIDLDSPRGRSRAREAATVPSGALKITVQKFYRVSGGSTQLRGVESDVVLPSGWDGFDEIHESALDFALPWDQIPPAPHVRTGAPEQALAELRARSEARIAANEKFVKLAGALAFRDKLDAEHEVSLVLEERRAEYAARKEALAFDEEEETDVSKLTLEERKALRRQNDYRLDEGLAVLADFVGLVR
jgi:carboxyl-terminal processing protease